MKLHYVIAAWGGPRRSDDPRAQTDRTFFLRTHLAMLAQVAHDLAAITIVVPTCSNEPPAFTRYLESLPHRVIRRSNVAFSYGSYTEAYRQTSDDFDGFIFVEDDYVFVEDHFDRKLAMIAEATTAGLVCGAALPQWDLPKHPAIAIGLCMRYALDWWSEHRSLPCDEPESAANYTEAERWQVRWGADFTALGIAMNDWLTQWASPYWTCEDTIRWYGNQFAPPMIMPIQAIGRMTDRVSAHGHWRDTYRGPALPIRADG